MKRFLFLILVAGFLLPTTLHAQAPGEIRATITKIITDETTDGTRRLIFDASDAQGTSYRVNSDEAMIEGIRYRVREGSRVYLQVVDQGEDQTVFLIDVVRTRAIVWIFILFAVVAVAIGWLQGGLALAGLAVTLLILFGFVFPRILSGSDPVLVTVLGSIVILGVNMHLSHGFSKKILLAFLSTVIGLMFVLIFAKLFVFTANLSGLASEESTLLYLKNTGLSIPSGLLLAGILLGAVGVLDDIAITQTETVSELLLANPKLKRWQLFSRAMRIGRHHIASVVNTLVLAYAGVALPLFLLFLTVEEMGFWRFMNEEVVAEEIVRTLSGTIGLILLVPIATLIAVLSQTRQKEQHSVR